VNPALAIGLAAAGGGVAYLVYRAVKASAKPSDPCAGLSGDALTACQALQLAPEVAQGLEDAGVNLGALNLLLGGSNNPHRNDSADNVKLNGAIKRAIPKAMIDQLGEKSSADAWVYEPLRYFTAPDLEYANGCIPYGDHPGFAKCAPGTHDLRNFDRGAGEIVDSWDWNGNQISGAKSPVRPDCFSGVGDGRVGCDPLSFPVDNTQMDSGPAAFYAAHFPLPAKPGFDRWWWKGVPTYFPTCPGGNGPWTGVDHRTGAADAPLCIKSPTSLPPPSPDKTVSSRGHDSSNLVFVSTPLPGHWERPR
jgi:hypothetical protein